MAAEANDLLTKTEVLASGARLVAVNLNIELHNWLCQCLKKTLDLVKEDLSDPSTRGRCRKILRELLKVAQKVNSLARDCCYNEREETEFIIAAIRLTDSAERFLLYHVELCWCRFLVEYMVKKDSAVNLGGFNWNERLRSVRGDTEFSRVRDADRSHMVTKLNNSLEKWGDHRRICKLLLLRFGYNEDLVICSLDDEPVPSLSDITHIKRGGQASVWKVKWKDKDFALKTFDNVYDVKAFRKEVDVFRTCSHPHILNMICSFEENSCGKIMMDLMFKDLDQHINGKPFNDLEYVDMILQVAQGMSYLHEQNVAHRDLKPHNILLKVDPKDVMDPVLKVADFGLARIRESLSSLSDNTPNVGTHRYRAPELYQNRHQEGAGTGKVKVDTFKADVFSFAITCSWILTGMQPYGADHEVQFTELPNQIKQGTRPYLPDECNETLSSLIRRCWDPTPSKRPSFAVICEELRLLKATLLTELRPIGQSFTERGGHLSPADECFRILVIGKPDVGKQISGKASLINQFPSSSGSGAENSQRERRLPSKPVCLHDTEDLNVDSMREIKSLVGERNKHWSTTDNKKSWHDYVTNSRPNPHTTRPVNRLHMVWFVFSRSNPPNRFEWDAILRDLCDLPVQILVVGTNEESDNDTEYREILNLGQRYYPKLFSSGRSVNENVERLGRWIVKVDLTDANDIERNLWAAFEAVQPAVEVKLPAKLILEIREKQGLDGFSLGNVLSKRAILRRSGDFVLTYLFDFWEVPTTLREIIKARLKCRLRQIEENPREFVLACGLAAALILYIKGRHPFGILSKSAPNNELSKTAVDDFFNTHLADLEQSLKLDFVDAPSHWKTRFKKFFGPLQVDEKDLDKFEDILQEYFKLGTRDRDG